MKDTRTIQTLASVSLIGGPLSLIIGGVLVSTAALVCGIVALVMLRSRKTTPNATDEMPSDVIAQTLFRQAVIGIAMSGLALVLNAASLAMMMPAMLEAVQTGDYSSLFSGGSTGNDASGTADAGGAFGGSSNDTSPSQSQSGRSSVWG